MCVGEQTSCHALATLGSNAGTLENATPDCQANLGPTGFQQQGTTAMSKRDEYVAKMKLQLDELNAKMDELEAKAKEAKAEARDKYNEEMGKLRDQSKLAVAKLEELKASGEDKWEAMVAEMEKIRDAFTHSYNYFKSQLKG
jgi:predicted  nucleic acid-binding Zn-ribbon protein